MSNMQTLSTEQLYVDDTTTQGNQLPTDTLLYIGKNGLQVRMENTGEKYLVGFMKKKNEERIAYYSSIGQALIVFGQIIEGLTEYETFGKRMLTM